MEEDEEERYRVWKKNSAFLYDLLSSANLEWPSLTVQFLNKSYSSQNLATVQQVILGTHTSNNEPNYLLLASAKFPTQGVNLKLDSENENVGGYGEASKLSNFGIDIKIVHDGEVNRARSMPQDEMIVATKTSSGLLYIFDVTKHPSTPVDNTKSKPHLKLSGHSEEGYGLDWNKYKKGVLLSCANDSTICAFDINSKNTNTITAEGNFVSPLFKRLAHTGTVGEVCWHQFDQDIFGSVGEDKLLKIWDMKLESSIFSVQAHSEDINSLHFSPKNDKLLITGSNDGFVNLWDLRNLTQGPIHGFDCNGATVLQVQWNPSFESVFACCTGQQGVFLFDASRVGEEQTFEASQDGPNELMFNHGGHTASISDFCWNPIKPNMLASVAEDNIIQFWEPNESVFYEESLADIVAQFNKKDLDLTIL